MKLVLIVLYVICADYQFPVQRSFVSMHIFFSRAILKPLLLQRYITESPLIHSINSTLSTIFSIFAQHLFKRLRLILFKNYSQLSITQTLMRTRGLLGTKTKAARDSVSSSYRIGFSIGIVLKRSGKRAQQNGSLTMGCIEFDLSSITVLESQL